MRVATVLAVSGALFVGGVATQAAVAAPGEGAQAVAAKKKCKKKGSAAAAKKKCKKAGPPPFQMAGKFLSRVQPNPGTQTTIQEQWNFCTGGIFKHVTIETDNFGNFETITERGTWTQLGPNPNGFSVGFTYVSRVRTTSDGFTENLLAGGPPVRAVTFVGSVLYLDSDAFAYGAGALCG